MLGMKMLDFGNDEILTANTRYIVVLCNNNTTTKYYIILINH